MERIHRTYLRQSHGCHGGIVYELRIQHLSAAPEESWTPAVNAYRFRHQIVVCVELAGVDRQAIELHAESRRLLIRGSRPPIELAADEGTPLQVFAIEIDQGFFQREIPLPMEIDPEQVRAEQRNGLLWIYLPIVP